MRGVRVGPVMWHDAAWRGTAGGSFEADELVVVDGTTAYSLAADYHVSRQGGQIA
ncbi:MAG: hypothetical protein ACKV0T_18330 [Planctomycetales bacterium]